MLIELFNIPKKGAIPMAGLWLNRANHSINQKGRLTI